MVATTPRITALLSPGTRRVCMARSSTAPFWLATKSVPGWAQAERSAAAPAATRSGWRVAGGGWRVAGHRYQPPLAAKPLRTLEKKPVENSGPVSSSMRETPWLLVTTRSKETRIPLSRGPTGRVVSVARIT